MFRIVYDPPAQRFLRKAERLRAERIVAKIEGHLPSNPVPQNAIALHGSHALFRIRVGDYRVLYRVDYALAQITIIDIDHRKGVYKHL